MSMMMSIKSRGCDDKDDEQKLTPTNYCSFLCLNRVCLGVE